MIIGPSVRGFRHDENAEAKYQSLIEHLRVNGADGGRGQHKLKGCKFGGVDLEQIGEQRDNNVRVRFYRHPAGYYKVTGVAKKKAQGDTRNDNSIDAAFNLMKDDLKRHAEMSRKNQKSPR